MKRFMSDGTNKKASMRLTAMIGAVVFAMGTLFVPTGIVAAETDEDVVLAGESVDAAAPAGVDEVDEVTEPEAADPETIAPDVETDAVDTEADVVQPEAEEPEAQQADADSPEAAAELEELVVAHDENGDAAALDDLNETDYDGFIYKLEDDVTKKEIKKMETAIDELESDPESGEAAELIDNELYTADSLETIDTVADADMIEYIEPDYVINVMGPNDPYYGGYGWFLEMTKAPYVWGRGAFGKGAVVAVLDTGVMTSHPDFENTHFVSPYNTTNGSTDITDTIGHGTGVAGIIAASYNNQKGLTGIMPQASIMPIKITSGATGGKHSWLIQGIDYAASHGADVINMSVGDPNESVAMNDACKRAAAKGVILVAASGNDYDCTIEYPASYSSVVSVGSIESNGAHSNFSTYNQYVDVVAPGRGILMPSVKDDKPGYFSMTGTSGSAPQVAAMAAMIKSLDKSVNGTGFKEILRTTCIDKGKAGRDDYFGYGLMDLSRAFNYMAKSFGLYRASLSCISYVYNGSPKSPAVTVIKANKTLPKANYKVTYPKNRKAVGTYKVTVTGLGQYVGSKTLTYKIMPPLVKKIKTPKRYKKKLQVRWYAMSKSQKAKYKSAITGYQVRIAKNSKFTKAKYVKVKGYAKDSVTVKKLKRKTTYYVQYRAYKTVGSKTYYSKWSGKKKVKTK